MKRIEGKHSGFRALIAGLLAACSVSAFAQQPVTLRFATFLPPNGLFTGADGIIGRFSKAIEKDSGGLVRLDILPGGTLGAAGRRR